MINKEQLTNVIKDLREVVKSEGLVISHDTLFSESMTTYRQLQIKAGNVRQQIEPMTDQQSAFIAKHDKQLRVKGFDIDNIQTKSQAHKIIKEFTKAWKKSN